MTARRPTSSCLSNPYHKHPIDRPSQLNLLTTLPPPGKLIPLLLSTPRHMVTRPVQEQHLLASGSEAEAYLVVVVVVVGEGPKIPDNVVRPVRRGR